MTIPRRTFLTGSAIAPAAILAACGESSETTSDPDHAVKSGVIQAERELIERYDAAIAAFPSLSELLTPLRGQHVEHLSALGAEVTGLSQSAAPASAASAVADLATRERVAVSQRIGACTQASAQQLAWTLSLIGASEASHAAVLAKAAA